MEGKAIDLDRLTLEELSGIAGIYPWFALARRELCVKMESAGVLTRGQLASAALYMTDRRLLPRLTRVRDDYSDTDVSELVRRFVSVPGGEEEPVAAGPVRRSVRPRVAGADFFTRDEYESVSVPGDSDFFRRPVTVQVQENMVSQEADVCTETLARIYEEQGYPEEARNIYSKLILAYPEKSAYFAALIEKTEK